jgi:hypothetical protein
VVLATGFCSAVSPFNADVAMYNLHTNILGFFVFVFCLPTSSSYEMNPSVRQDEEGSVVLAPCFFVHFR